jgi:hypothetical protein
VDSL